MRFFLTILIVPLNLDKLPGMPTSIKLYNKNGSVGLFRSNRDLTKYSESPVLLLLGLQGGKYTYLEKRWKAFS